MYIFCYYLFKSTFLTSRFWTWIFRWLGTIIFFYSFLYISFWIRVLFLRLLAYLYLQLKEKPRKSWEWFRLTLKEIRSLKHVRIGYLLFIALFFFQISTFSITMLVSLAVIFKLRRIDFCYLFLHFFFHIFLWNLVLFLRLLAH